MKSDKSAPCTNAFKMPYRRHIGVSQKTFTILVFNMHVEK